MGGRERAATKSESQPPLFFGAQVARPDLVRTYLPAPPGPAESVRSDTEIILVGNFPIAWKVNNDKTHGQDPWTL